MKTIINTSYIKNLLLLALILLTSSVFSQEEEEEKKKVTFSGSVDAYYRTNLNGLNKEVPIIEGGVQTGSIIHEAPGTSFANQVGFALGMANVIGRYDGEKVGFVADLVFGPRGEEAVFGSPFGSSNIINQLYVYWNVSEKVTLTLGNFNTFLGYEVISPVGNFNYSTSYMFSYGPFSHAGVKADFDLGNDWTVLLAIMNRTDLTAFNPIGDLTVGAQLGYAGQFLNVIVGKQDFDQVLVDGVLTNLDVKTLFQIDFTGGFDITESFYLGLNGTYQDTDGLGFYGAALYPQYKTSDTFTIGLRGEYFKEQGNFGAIGTGVADSDVFAVTLTGSAIIGEYLTIKPEIRFDNASDDAFINSDLEAQDNLASFLLAAVFAF